MLYTDPVDEAGRGSVKTNSLTGCRVECLACSVSIVNTTDEAQYCAVRLDSCTKATRSQTRHKMK